MRLGLALPQYDYSVAGESPLRVGERRRVRARRRGGRVRLALAVGPPLPRRREVRRAARPRRRVSIRSSRSPRSRREVHARAPRHARAVRGVAPGRRCSPSRSPASTRLRRSARRRHRRRAGTSPSTRRSAWTMPRPGERLDAAARGDRGAARSARRWPVHVRRPLPPRRRRGERAGRGAAADAADHRGRQGRSPAPARRRARRRLEHVLGVDAGRRTASASRCSTRACDAVGRDPASVTRSLGLYALCGEDERDLERRFERLQERHAARRARRRDPRAVARGSAGGHGRAGAGAGGRLGGARGRDPDRRARGGAVRGDRARRPRIGGPTPSEADHGLRHR